MTEEPSHQLGSTAAGDAMRMRGFEWAGGIGFRNLRALGDLPAKWQEDPDEAFVFRDFERSKITSIRVAIDRNPLRYSFLFLSVTLFWTVLMSAGAGLYGSNGIVLNQTPNIALFCIALGVFLYPPRLFWVPMTAFVCVFSYPFFNPFVSGQMWFQNAALSADFVTNLFLANLLSGLLIGLSLRCFFYVAGRIWRPHSADLILSIFGFFAFVAITLLQLQITLSLTPSLSPVGVELLGFDAHLNELAHDRIFRGGVVLTAFLLGAIELPNHKQFRTGLLLACLYPMIAFAQSRGFVLYPMLDIAAFTVTLIIILPVPTALVAAILGTASYSGLTGHFLGDDIPASAPEATLKIFSTLLLVISVLLLAVRSRASHVLQSKDSSMRRLNRVRDFAGVGLFSTNLTTGRYRLDSAAGRLLSRDVEGPLYDLLQSFDIATRDKLTEVLVRRGVSGETLTLALPRGTEPPIMLDILVWSETAFSGDDVTYGLMLDVTDDTARKQALQAALDDLRLREDRQRQMFSVISHEVRTPASVISMLVDELPDDRPEQTRSQLREATDQLLAVLGDMRQAVNPEKNLPIRKLPYIPADLAKSIVASLRHTAHKANMTISLDLDPSAGGAREGDTMRSRQVLTNLMRNALIHSQGTHLTLSFQGASDSTGHSLSVWTVTDNGRGIPAEDEPTIFDAFERGSDDSRKRADGSGLGLFIARSSVAVLGGTLRHLRPAMGGASFVVTLPEPEVFLPDPKLMPTPAAAPDPDIADLSILLAEDNPLVAEVMSTRLRRDFSKIRVVNNGQALVDACLAEPADVVLTDLFMPGLDGDQATSILRGNGYSGQIIGLTAAAAGDESQRFLNAGADAVMFKPLDVQEFRRILGQSRAKRATD